MAKIDSINYLTPGRVLILVAGKYAGKRVVCLKNFNNGMLAIAGPRAVNGVPLRYVNFRYVKATSTVLDISKVNLDSVTEALLKTNNSCKKQRLSIGSKDDLISKRLSADKVVAPELAAVSAELDRAIGAIIEAHPEKDIMVSYMRTKFSLRANDKLHEMVF